MIEFPQDLPEECVLYKHSSFLCLCQMSKHLSQVDVFNKCGFIPESLIVSLLLATFNSTFIHTFTTRLYQNVKGDVLWHILWSFVPFRKHKTKEQRLRCPEQPAEIRVRAASPHNRIHLHRGQTAKRWGCFSPRCWRVLSDTHSVTLMDTSAKAQNNDMLGPNLLMMVDPVVFFGFFFKPQTCASGCCQPLQHLRDSLVSVWANAGSPPGFLNTPSQYPHPPTPHRPQHCRSPPSRCCESLWCHQAPLIPFSAPLTDRLRFVVLGPSPPFPSQLYF